MSEEDAKKIPALLDERDRAYIEAMPNGDEREAALCTVTTYRRPDRLKPGDPLPELELTALKDGGTIKLASERDRPLVLLFGSYT